MVSLSSISFLKILVDLKSRNLKKNRYRLIRNCKPSCRNLVCIHLLKINISVIFTTVSPPYIKLSFSVLMGNVQYFCFNLFFVILMSYSAFARWEEIKSREKKRRRINTKENKCGKSTKPHSGQYWWGSTQVCIAPYNYSRY